jgi:hypothetical protein
LIFHRLELPGISVLGLSGTRSDQRNAGAAGRRTLNYSEVAYNKT